VFRVFANIKSDPRILLARNHGMVQARVLQIFDPFHFLGNVHRALHFAIIALSQEVKQRFLRFSG